MPFRIFSIKISFGEPLEQNQVGGLNQMLGSLCKRPNIVYIQSWVMAVALHTCTVVLAAEVILMEHRMHSEDLEKTQLE